MTGVTAVLAGMSGQVAGTVSLTNRNAYASDFEPAFATATYILGSDGVVESTGEASGFWIAPQTGMNLFEVRAVLNSGALTSGTTGAWLSLGTSRSWENSSNTQPGQSANLTIQIRRSGDTAILASATVTVTAEVFA